jgi:hypothetical protein
MSVGARILARASARYDCGLRPAFDERRRHGRYAAGGARAWNESVILTGGISTAIAGRHTGRTGSGIISTGGADVLPVAINAMEAQIGQ